jgi:hypothetical protein
MIRYTYVVYPGPIDIDHDDGTLNKLHGTSSMKQDDLINDTSPACILSNRRLPHLVISNRHAHLKISAGVLRLLLHFLQPTLTSGILDLKDDKVKIS